MNTNIIKSKSFLFFLTILFCLCTSKLFASQASEEWIDVDVVVNVVDGANAANIDDAIKKANEILKKAKVRLVKKGTDPNAKADSDNSGALDKTERDKAREEGQKALNKAVGPGKGIKIDVANNIDANDASAVGISIHRNPVIIVEPDPNSNELGKTMTHELGHVFTLDYDLNDVNFINRLMYAFTGSGTDLTPGEVNEIRQGARLRGRPYFIVPRILSGGSVAVPGGIDYSINRFGAILDNFHDVFVNDPYFPIVDPNDPRNQYADIGEVMIWDEMIVKGTHIDYYIKTNIELGVLPVNAWNVDSFFDISYQVEFGPPLGHAQIALQNWAPVSAIWFDANNMPTPVILDVQVDTESEFSGMPHYAVPHNKTVRVRAPLDDIILTPDMPGPIIATISSQHIDYRYWPDPAVIMLMDYTLPFKISNFPPCLTAGLTFVDLSTVSHPDGQITGNLTINGCCFDKIVTSGLVSVSTDQSLIYPEHPVTVTDSRFSVSIPATLLRPNPGDNWPKWYRVDFTPDYHGPPENAPQGATGFFKYCPGGEIEGDINSDCVVNLYDLAVFAQNWLADSRL